MVTAPIKPKDNQKNSPEAGFPFHCYFPQRGYRIKPTNNQKNFFGGTKLGPAVVIWIPRQRWRSKIGCLQML